MNDGRGDLFVEWAHRALANPNLPVPVVTEMGILPLGLYLCGRDAEALSVVSSAGSGALRLDQVGATAGRGQLRLAGDDLDGAREDLQAVVEACRRFGTSLQLIHALGVLAVAEFRAGEWDESQMHAELALSLATDGDVSQFVPHLNAIAAQVPALRGDADQAGKFVHAALTAAAKPGNKAALVYAATASAILGYSRGRDTEVVAATDPLLGLADHIGAHDPTLVRWQELRIEALIRLGRFAEADEMLTSFARRAAARTSHSAFANAARVRGLLAAASRRLGEAAQAFEDALAQAAAVNLPFEQAQIHLQFGAHLRRTGHRSAAAEQLRKADEIFRQLGARPFIEMAARELTACGLARRTGSNGPRPLTTQEWTVARLVSAGKSNREVAGELFISIKTVEYHLGHIYAKYGLRSRGQLIAHLYAAHR